MRIARHGIAAMILALAPPVLAQEPPAEQEAILWYRAPARCTYFTPAAKTAFRPDDPQTWRFAFLVMRESKADDPAERGYVMVDGVLRELEKVRSGADAAQANVTVWRSAGEPRVNVNMTVREAGRTGEAIELAGTMTLIRGDGRRETAVEGHCTG